MSEFMVIYEDESGKFFFSSQHFEVLEVCSNSQLFLKQWFSVGVHVGCVFTLFKGHLAIPGYIMFVTAVGCGGYVCCRRGVGRGQIRC